MDIDFVVTWVDGNDPKWFAEYSKYNPNQISDANHKSRFRDWGTFRYLFRAFDKFTPWVNKIHLVTMDQKPEWLNTKADKLNLVSHRDIFLDDSYLPTFNSYAIEANINHIKE